MKKEAYGKKRKEKESRLTLVTGTYKTVRKKKITHLHPPIYENRIAAAHAHSKDTAHIIHSCCTGNMGGKPWKPHVDAMAQVYAMGAVERDDTIAWDVDTMMSGCTNQNQ